MWIMTPRGFYSVVQHRDEPAKVLVRARCKQDIDALADLIPAKPFQTPVADYNWRLVCTAAEWTHALTVLSSEIKYPNFKNAINDDKHHRAYSEVWGVLLTALDDRHTESDSRWQDDNWADYDLWEPPLHRGRRVGDRNVELTVEDLDSLPAGSVVSTTAAQPQQREVWTRVSDGWLLGGGDTVYDSRVVVQAGPVHIEWIESEPPITFVGVDDPPLDDEGEPLDLRTTDQPASSDPPSDPED